MKEGLERLILALDVERPDEGRDLLTSLAGGLKYVKIGHQLYACGGMRFLPPVAVIGRQIPSKSGAFAPAGQICPRSAYTQMPTHSRIKLLTAIYQTSGAATPTASMPCAAATLPARYT